MRGSTVLKESWQPIDHAGIEAKALGTRNQFGVGDVINIGHIDLAKAMTDLKTFDNLASMAVGCYAIRQSNVHACIYQVFPLMDDQKVDNWIA